MLVAPVTPASPRSPRGPFAPENSVNFTLSVFRFYNSNIGITSYRALGHLPRLELVHIYQFVNFWFSSLCKISVISA